MDEKEELEAQEPGLPSAVEETVPAPADSAGPDTPADDEEPPFENKVFGMRRRTFHLVVVGYALGIIVVSLMGIAGLLSEDAGTVFPGMAGAALGYLLAKYLDKRDADRAPDEPKQ